MQAICLLPHVMWVVSNLTALETTMCISQLGLNRICFLPLQSHILSIFSLISLLFLSHFFLISLLLFLAQCKFWIHADPTNCTAAFSGRWHVCFPRTSSCGRVWLCPTLLGNASPDPFTALPAEHPVELQQAFKKPPANLQQKRNNALQGAITQFRTILDFETLLIDSLIR